MGVGPDFFKSNAEEIVGTTPVRVGETGGDRREIAVRNLRLGIMLVKIPHYFA